MLRESAVPPFQALLAPRSPKTSNKNRNKRTSYPPLSTAFAHFPKWESPICNIPNDLRTLVKTPGGCTPNAFPTSPAMSETFNTSPIRDAILPLESSGGSRCPEINGFTSSQSQQRSQPASPEPVSRPAPRSHQC